MSALPPRTPDGFSMTLSSGRLTSSIYFPTAQERGWLGSPHVTLNSLPGRYPWRVLLPGPAFSLSPPLPGRPRPASCCSLPPPNTSKLLWSTNPQSTGAKLCPVQKEGEERVPSPSHSVRQQAHAAHPAPPEGSLSPRLPRGR